MEQEKGKKTPLSAVNGIGFSPNEERISKEDHLVAVLTQMEQE
jgi:hypothetical protein